MSNIFCLQSEKGTVKDVNQDSVALRILKAKNGEVTFVVVCDGMGGYEKGEIASATVAHAMLNWLTEDFKQIVDDFTCDDLFAQWNYCIQMVNRKIIDYGRTNQIDLGTTLTALLLYDNKYYFCHVGDSRIYLLRDNSIKQLTEDHTYVAKLVKEGKISEDQIETHPDRNVLMQCVGASSRVLPQFEQGDYCENDLFLLCSDGFRHEVSADEMLEALKNVNTTVELNTCISRLIERVEMRQEEDNITAAVVKIIP